MSYLTRFLLKEQVELDPSELELTPEELRPAPLTGASVEKARTATENNLLKLRERRETLLQEIRRLQGELVQTETVLKSQEAAFAALDEQKSEALPGIPLPATHSAAHRPHGTLSENLPTGGSSGVPAETAGRVEL